MSDVPVAKVNPFKKVLGKKVESTVNFMGEEVVINKLTVKQVEDIQKMAQQGEDEDDNSLDVLIGVFKLAVPDAKDISADEFKSFPIDELTKFSNEIMKFSGMQQPGK